MASPVLFTLYMDVLIQRLEAQTVGCYVSIAKWSDSVKHLGNMINAHNYDRDDIKRKKSDFIARTNSILANFRSASGQAKTKLFTNDVDLKQALSIPGEARLKQNLSVQSEHQKRAAAIIDFLDLMVVKMMIQAI